MRFNAKDKDGQTVLVAFALEGYDKGAILEFSLFSFRENLSPGVYTLMNGERAVQIVLPIEATRQAIPGHLAVQSVRKAVPDGRPTA